MPISHRLLPLLALVVFLPRRATATAATALSFVGDGSTGLTTLPTYASFNIDSSCNRGFHQINFTNPNLVAAARALRPSKLRFGGSGNDYLKYQLEEGSAACSAEVSTPECSYFTPGCLNQTHWDALFQLSQEASADFIFGLSFDLEQACSVGSKYVWNASNAAELVRYTRQHAQNIWGFELGNEINNHGGAPCNLTASQQVDALKTLSAMVDPAIALIGPDTGYRNAEQWLKAYLAAENRPALTAVTHHVYAGLKADNFDTPAALDASNADIEWYSSILRAEAPSAQMWAGEDGPAAGGDDGTCGGNTSICGKYASAVWYADDLGLRALRGFVQFQRQDLFGAAYGLTGSTVALARSVLSHNEALALRPGYWVNFLFKRTVGISVLNVTSSDPMIRSYGFKGLPPSPHAANDCTTGASGYSLLLLNLQRNTSTVARLPNGASTFSAWILESSGAAGVFSKSVSLNGKPLPATVDISGGGATDFLRNIPVPPVNGTTDVTLPPSSIAFVCVQ